MPAPSTTAGQTSAAASPSPGPSAGPGAPRGRRRAPGPSAAAEPGADPRTETRTDPRAETRTETVVDIAVGTGGGAEQTGDVVRWAVFCCALVPVVLVLYGTSLGGAAGTALGLVAVTAACRLLLRRSERGLRAEAVRPRRRN
ncbi:MULTISPECIES: hypothetical protein [Streptomyces]|uniref:Uncharacterized protein n=1 Tax=Streptomyces nymphaeiformis TaxID=2663842 RepID=A0A7W7TTZ6_9ACTN|nr:hypothetical protein [Streptomyces nymphaeiformis]MBB4979296.1 hypothetical protein [Streptomyces nymphaeiformis]